MADADTRRRLARLRRYVEAVLDDADRVRREVTEFEKVMTRGREAHGRG